MIRKYEPVFRGVFQAVIFARRNQHSRISRTICVLGSSDREWVRKRCKFIRTDWYLILASIIRVEVMGVTSLNCLAGDDVDEDNSDFALKEVSHV